MVIYFPFSAIDNCLNLGFNDDTRTRHIVCLSFCGPGVRGDFGTLGASVASPSSSLFTQGSRVTSANRTLVLAAVIFSTLYLVGHVLMGGKVAWFSMLCIGSNFTQPSVTLGLPQGIL